jgi:tRNA-specific 2-thiouridylase
MSGGVDSSVAALLLREAGHEVVGVFLSNGVGSGGGSRHQGCCGLEDALDARRVADRLGIPFYAIDLAAGFAGLIDDFVESYLRGRTPNPCIECNRRFKFGHLLGLADRLGFEAVATGHYARLVGSSRGRALARAADRAKDQSYVLFSVPAPLLERVHLPLGGWSKDSVRARARDAGLPVAEKAESMEICFVPGGDYRELVRSRAGDRLRAGAFLTAGGEEVGRHEASAFFTVGQRRGLPPGFPEAQYVTGIDPESGAVRIGPRKDLLVWGLQISGLNAGAEEPFESLGQEYEVQLRAHHRPVRARVCRLAGGLLEARFAKPESGVVPGQAAVFYRSDVVAFGGWIEAALPMEPAGTGG